MGENVYTRIGKFHAHLDVCSQCRDHPFGLCSTGAQLLKDAATGELDGGPLSGERGITAEQEDRS